MVDLQAYTARMLEQEFIDFWNRRRIEDRASTRQFYRSLLFPLALIFFGLTLMILTGCASQPPAPPMVIVKHDLMPPPKPVIPPDPLAGIPASVQDAIQRNEDAPVQEGVTTYYRYDPNGSWTINCQPLFETQIRLAPDEQIETKDDVAIGDPSRWTYRVNRHSIYVRPKAASFNIWATGPQAGPPALIEVADHNVTTNIVIRTNKRSYTIIAHLRKPLTQAIAWYYTDDIRTAEAERNQVIKEVELQEHNNGSTPITN